MAEKDYSNISSISSSEEKRGILVESGQGSIRKEIIPQGSGKFIEVDIDAINYESLRAKTEQLTFNILEKSFNKVGIKFDKDIMFDLGLVKSKNVYTNLAVLLSEQCKHTIKLNIFEGNSKTQFRERFEFTGSVLKQFYEVCNFIDKNFENRFPIEAVKAAVSNAIIHRNYSYSGSILVNIFLDQIEVLSIGGLIGQITVDDILAGICQPRNMKLAEVFSLVEATESYGAGMQKILTSYQNVNAKPAMKITDNLFVIKLPNVSSNAVELTKHEKAVMEYILENTSITRKEAETILGVSQTMAGIVLRKLVQKEMLKQVGMSVSSKYVVNI